MKFLYDILLRLLCFYLFMTGTCGGFWWSVIWFTLGFISMDLYAYFKYKDK